MSVSERTVSRYLPKRPAPAGSAQNWKAFLQNHRPGIAGMDFNAEVVAALRAMRIQASRTAYRSPWQDGVAERWVGSVRRELLDHVIVFNRRHLMKLLRAYLDYYDKDRTHLTLRKDAPETRAVEMRPSPDAKVMATPRVGGLHHRYEWRTAA